MNFIIHNGYFIRAVDPLKNVLDLQTFPPCLIMYFSTAKLLSKLNTNFLIPSLIAFTTPKPNVISEDFFSPLITKITLSES